MPQEKEPLFCNHCSVSITPGRGEFYAVCIDAVADPSPPSFREEDMENIAEQITALFAKLKHLSEQEAMDQVTRRVVLYLCNACYNRWIENPTGGR
jgi:hypothetical protein